MPPRFHLPERLSIAALVVLLEPEAFGLGEVWACPPGLAYGPLVVIMIGLLVDRQRLGQALRSAADAVDPEDPSPRDRGW